jgi:chorismate-pyruvate lyase
VSEPNPDFPPSPAASAISPFVALEVMQDLSDALIGGGSATLTLEAWVADLPAGVTARRIENADRPAPPGLRERLDAAPDEIIAYRHVQLVCGEHVLSEAQNWYLPARLTPAMRDELATTDTPFGRVILPLGPVRETTKATMLWDPSQDGPDMPQNLFEHRARVFSRSGAPLAEVVETYTREAVLVRMGR